MFEFRAMNTQVAVTATAEEEAEVAARIAALFWRAERTFSRFRPDSELSRLNRAIGPMTVSTELFGALVRARAYLEQTEGLFDPAIGASLIALGYDRSWEPGLLDRERSAPAPSAASLREVKLDPARHLVDRPQHVTLDLGGMIKGHTVDLAGELLGEGGAVDAGGDAIVLGQPPDGEEWWVELEDPRDPERTVATVSVRDRGVATSAANRRRWRLGERTAHHLIDPRTRLPSETDLLQATVIAQRTELADVLAKTAFLLGATEGRRFLERQPGVGAVLIPVSGRPLFLGELELREVADA